MIHALWAFIPIVPALLVSLIIGIIPAFLLRLVALKRASDWWAFLHARIMSRLILFCLGVDAKVCGLENLSGLTGPVCYVSNHQSVLDIPLILGRLGVRTGFICKKEVAYMPIINIWVFCLHSIFMDRSSLHKSSQSIKNGARRIEQGHAMAIFPEGSRSKTDSLAPFKRGAFKLATLSGSTVVPITIRGLRPALEDRKRMFIKIKCNIVVGKPVLFAKDLDRNDIAFKIDEIETGMLGTYGSLPCANA